MTAKPITTELIATSAQHARKIFPIAGGVHPPQNKSQSLQRPLVSARLPEKVILPLAQHIGAPAKPLVAVGERVLTGQLVAEAKGFVSANIHASISGTVESIEELPIPHPSGLTGPCIIIHSDGKDEKAAQDECENYMELGREELIEKIRSAGLIGMGGAGFPTSVKLAGQAPIEHLIINGTECEPYITADDILMRNYPYEIIHGVELLAHLLGNPKDIVIGLEENKPEALAALRDAAMGTNIQVVSFPCQYPSGGEKQLIQRLTGKEVPSGKLPIHVGAVVQNIGTTYSAYRAVRYGEPLIKRITTIVGDALEHSGNIEARIGTPVSDLLDQFGFKAKKSSQLIMGGPMMGFVIPNADVPVLKTTNCIIAPSKKEMPPVTPAQACIRCGMCAEACPAQLLPQQLYWYARSDDHEKLLTHNLFDCIECGACSYVCPSHIPLVQYYRAAKGAIRTEREEKAKSDRSRKRFEFKQERIAKAEAEKEAKRLARQKAAQEAKKKLEEQKAQSGSSEATPTKPAAPKVEDERARLERTLASAQTRLESAKNKHQEAVAENSDRVEQLAAKVKQAETRVEDAKSKLAALETAPANTSADNSQASAPTSSSTNADNPVEKAIAKAMAKQSMSPYEKVKSSVESLTNRLEKAQQKHAQAVSDGGDNIDALALGVEKLKEKLDAAQQELKELAPDEPAKEVAQKKELDPAQAAIEKAKAKALAKQSMSPYEKAQSSVESLTNRLEKAQQKHAQAVSDGSENVDALALGVEKLKEKLNAAQQELKELAPKEPAKEADQKEKLDPAQAAIERAKAKAAANAQLTPKEKLANQIESLKTRIGKAQTKYDTAVEENSDNQEALSLGLNKLKQKLEATEKELAELEE
ncbi:electron transport complex subunit RsxC [Sessilibacter corallicola]|uniref:Ion-translocating oxidoreductase complex subunit C n=1 Tax=Sessilibacter corallicola TaxID=2904075 RepID=A0ABQ0A6A0_9GAMM